MIIEHENGRPFHIMTFYDPAMPTFMASEGKAFVCLAAAPDFDVIAEGYVDAGELRRRPVLPITIDKTVIAADDADAVTIAGLPDPCIVFIDEAPHEVAGGVLTFTSPMPAVYRLRVDLWPAMPWDADIRAE